MSIVPGRDVPAVPDEWVDAVNKAINDAYHEDLCMCDGWPDACASGYQSDRWDLGVSLTIAVGVLEPLLRERVAAEVAAAQSDPPRLEWANRMERGGQSAVMPVGPANEGGGERLARHRLRYAWYTALLRRTVTFGPWVEVPADNAGLP